MHMKYLICLQSLPNMGFWWWKYQVTVDHRSSNMSWQLSPERWKRVWLRSYKTHKNFPKKNILDVAAFANKLSGGFSGYRLKVSQVLLYYFSCPRPDAEWKVSCSRDDSSARWGLCLYVCTCHELIYHSRVSKKWVFALQRDKVSQNFLRWKAFSEQNVTRVASLGHQLDNQYSRVYSRLLPLSPMHRSTLTPLGLRCSSFAVSSAYHADSQ